MSQYLIYEIQKHHPLYDVPKMMEQLGEETDLPKCFFDFLFQNQLETVTDWSLTNKYAMMAYDAGLFQVSTILYQHLFKILPAGQEHHIHQGYVIFLFRDIDRVPIRIISDYCLYDVSEIIQADRTDILKNIVPRDYYEYKYTCKHMLSVCKFLMVKHLSLVTRYYYPFMILAYSSYLGNMDVVDNLLEMFKNKMDLYDDYPLKLAAYSGHLEIVKRLLFCEPHESPHSINSQFGYQDFFESAEQWQVDYRIGILDNIDVNELIDSRTELAHYDALSCAAFGGHYAVAEYLLFKYEAKMNRHENITNWVIENVKAATLFAVRRGNIDVLKLLAEWLIKMSKISKKNREWFSSISDLLIINACYHGRYQIVKLLDSYGVNLRARDDVPIKLAAMNGYFEIIQYLVSRDVPVHPKGNCTYGLASLNGHSKLAKFIKNGTTHDCANCIDQWMPGMEESARRRFAKRYTTLLSTVEDISELGDNYETLTVPDEHRDMILHKFCLKGEKKWVEHFIELGADINYQAQEKITVCCRKNRQELLEILVYQGLTYDTTNCEPLSCAIKSNDFKMVKYLVFLGFKPDLDLFIEACFLDERCIMSYFIEKRIIQDEWIQAACNQALIDYKFGAIMTLIKKGAKIDDQALQALENKLDVAHNVILIELILKGHITANQNNSSLLYEECKIGNLMMVKFLIKHGADQLAVNNRALKAAVVNNRYRCYKFLLSCRDYCTQDDIDVLIELCEYPGREPWMKFLRDKKINIVPKIDEIIKTIIEHETFTNFWYLETMVEPANKKQIYESLLIQGCRYANFWAVDRALRCNVDPNIDSGNPICFAVISGDLNVMTRLVNAGADATARNSFAFKQACRNGHLHFIECLVRSGFDWKMENMIGLKIAKDNNRESLVQYFEVLMGMEIKKKGSK